MYKPRRARGSIVSRVLLLFLSLTCFWSGCHSPNVKQSSRLASVTIKNSTVSQVEDVTRDVFSAHEYLELRTNPGEFVFEKQGTGMNTFVYGDWSEKKVWVRVKVFVSELVYSKEVLLECDAYMVTEHGDKRF